jgi:succinyl-diaminopimelate desuccinylase
MNDINIDPIDLTSKLLSFDTINPPGHERECAEYLGSLLEAKGFKISFYESGEKRTNLIADLESGGEKAPIIFTGHMDTVPLGEAAWQVDPFGGEIVGDKIFGRGSSDMKGGLAAIVAAAMSLADESEINAGMTLVLTADEETGCKGAAYLAGLDNVLKKAGALVVAEPTSNIPFIGHKGALGIQAVTTGITAHGSMPQEGVNAIYKAADAVIKLREYNFDIPSHPILGTPTLNVGTMSGGLNLNSVPDRAVVGIDIRTIPGQDNQKTFKDLQIYLGEDVELRLLLSAESVTTDPQNEWVQGVLNIMEPLLKERPVPQGATYFTDASALTQALGNPPTIILGPGEQMMAHKTDEYCHVSKIKTATEAYFQIAKMWCLSSL